VNPFDAKIVADTALGLLPPAGIWTLAVPGESVQNGWAPDAAVAYVAVTTSCN